MTFARRGGKTRERSVRVDYNEPFDHLLSRLIPARLHHELETKKTSPPDAPGGRFKGY